MSLVRSLPVALGVWLLVVPSVRAAEDTTAAVVLPDLVLLNQQQQAMTLTTGWGLASVGTGAALLARPTDGWTRAFATQQVVWGVIDAGIGLWALQDFEKRRALPADPGQKPWLHNLYLVNAALDVGYMAAGLALMAQPDDQLKGHGAGVLLQGAWLALFDGANAWLTRPAP
ncbi:MAG: hypothetical protein VKP57_06365 [Candidatus Sericytochromatia bacterium]|nr:hypothetical protein [Candidatus Sericytochromatia bacterium]